MTRELAALTVPADSEDRPCDDTWEDANTLWEFIAEAKAAVAETREPDDFTGASNRSAVRALRRLEQTAIMLETWAPECFPANELGQVHFARALMESAAEAIREAWKTAIDETVAATK